MKETTSHWSLTNTKGQPATAQSIEVICDELMLELLEIEQVTEGHVHSASISANVSDSSVTVELTVNADSQQEADEIAAVAVANAVSRAGHVVGQAGASMVLTR